MKYLLILIMLWLVSGCATIDKLKAMTNNGKNNDPIDLRAAWEGQSLINLEKHAAFGVPTEKSSLSDGSIAYVYQFYGAASIRSSGGSIYGTTHSNSRIEQAQCKFTFYAKNNVITDLNMLGNCYKGSERLPN